MEALLHRDDIPMEIVLTKALRETINKCREAEYIKTLSK